MANINDVAKLAGVGVSTVSKVFKGYTSVSDATKKKVLAAAEELNYVPNSIASALSSKGGRRVALVVFINNQRQAIDEINMQYIFGALHEAKKLKLDVITVFSTEFEGKNEAQLQQYFRSLHVQSIIIFGLHRGEESFFSFIENSPLNIVVVDAPVVGEKVSYVMVDHTKAQKDITEFMIKNHENVQNVLYLAGRRDGFVTELRLLGVVSACEDLGIKLIAKYSDFSEEKAYELTMKYAQESSIIICASDLMAIGAIQALKKLDIYRPVSGFDGITLLAYVGYQIYTVRQDFYQISKEAMRAVDRLMQGGHGEEILLDYEITRIKYTDVIQ